MEFGRALPWTGPLATPEHILATAVRSEQLGYDFVSIGEHLLYPKSGMSAYPYTPDGSLPIDQTSAHLEILTTFAFISSQTTKLRMHSGVLVLPYRSPVLTAKQIATLDYLSGGRLVLPIGVGWMPEEFEILGLSFQDRGRLTDECLEVMRALFEERGPYRGHYFNIPEVDFAPLPVQRPFPIYIGGGAKRVTLERVARYGQGWCPLGIGNAEIAEGLSRLAELMAENGRESESIVVSADAGAIPSPGGGFSKDATLEQLKDLADAGVTEVTMVMGEFAATDISMIEDVGAWFASEVMPEARSW